MRKKWRNGEEDSKNRVIKVRGKAVRTVRWKGKKEGENQNLVVDGKKL